MKVVLLKDVKGTGRAHTAVDVKDGHALNLLIPRGLAVPATAAALAQADSRAKIQDAQKTLSSKLIEERLAALSEGKVTFVKKANEKGHLYDAVDAKEIAEAAALPVDSIHIEKPFKEIGVHDVPVAYGENFGKLSIEIVAE